MFLLCALCSCGENALIAFDEILEYYCTNQGNLSTSSKSAINYVRDVVKLDDNIEVLEEDIIELGEEKYQYQTYLEEMYSNQGELVLNEPLEFDSNTYQISYIEYRKTVVTKDSLDSSYCDSFFID